MKLRPRRSEAVDRVAAVAVAECHPAVQDLLGRQLQESADELVQTYPGYLRTSVKPVAARQERQRMNIAAKVRPPARSEPAIDRDEETHRCVEELVAAFKLLEPSGTVLTVGAERPV